MDTRTQVRMTPAHKVLADTMLGKQAALTMGVLTLGAPLLMTGCAGGETTFEPGSPAVSFATASMTLDEANATTVITVVLASPSGDLTEDLTVEVVDAGTGSATEGADYVAIGRQTVTFPTGSQTGAVQTVTVQSISDLVAEGADETVTVRLENPEGGRVAGVTSSTVTIEDAQTASVSFSTPSTITGDESASTYTLNVTLDLTPGATLGFDIDMAAVDDATGTASSGDDYVAIPTTAVSFLAGTADGTVRQMDVQVLDDAALEGPEFFAVTIDGAVSTQLTQDGPMRHVVTITDDESPPSPAFVAASGLTGSETMHASGDTIALGTQLNGAGPNVGTLVTITNQGGGPMDLGQPILAGDDNFDFDVEIESSSMPAVGAQSAPGEDLDLATPFVMLDASPSLGDGEQAKPGLAAAFDATQLSELDIASTVRLHGVPLPNLGEVTLQLERIALPIADDAVLSINGNPVTGGPRALIDDLSTWRGTAMEIPGSRVFLMLTEAGPEGFVQLPFEEGRTIHIHTEEAATAGSPAMCRLVHEADLLALGAERPPLCGGTALVPGTTRDLDAPTALATGGPSTGQLVTTTNCRLAIETDFQFYEKFNDSTALTNYVTSLVAAISDQYRTDVQTTLSIAYLGIHDNSNDGWTSQDTGGDAEDVLLEFRANWNANGWPQPADLAHFLSGADLGGGIAYLDVLCNQSFAYGVSGDLNGNINWATWTGTPGSFTWDFVVVAHELGHNFGADHTHEYCPPIDVCYANCNGGTSCSQGTIMSYCHACGGMDNIDLHFHQQIATRMRQEVESSCLTASEVPAGDFVRYRLRFAPESGAGAKTATLRFTHDAPNAPSPFVLNLTATAN